MSLLLDALKKAEEAKRRKLAEQASAGEAAPDADATSPALVSDTPDAPPALDLLDQPSSPEQVEPAKQELTLSPVEYSAPEPEPAEVAAAEAEPTPAPTSAHVLAFAAEPTPPATDPADATPAPVNVVPEPAAAQPVQAPPTPAIALAAERLSGRSGKGATESGRTEPVIGATTAPTPPAGPAASRPVAKKEAAPLPEPQKSPAQSPDRSAPAPVKAEPRVPNGNAPGPAKLSPAAAKQLFDAKKRPAAPLSTRQRWFYIGGVLVLGILSAGGWFWWQSRAVGGNTLLAPNTQPPTFAASPTLPASEPEKAPAPVDPRAATPAADANKPPATTPTAPSSPAPATAQEHAEAPLDIGKPAVTNHPPVEPKPGDRAKVIEVPANVAASDVHFVRDSATASVPTTVANAYQAFQRGDYATALMQYRHYLDIDPRSRDALLGIGAAAVRLGQMDEARQAYRTALAVDPKDAVASAALASLANDGDIEGSEGKLRQIYDAQPTPAAASALGGLLSRQGRWREAQDYYFRAYNAAPNDPDNAFNLAVSLDALGERKLAAEYYGKALGLSGGSFDRSAAKRRLDSLNTR